MDAKWILPMLSLIESEFLDFTLWQYNSRFVEPKGSLHLVVGNLPRNLGNILVEHATHVLVVAEDERLLEIEPTGDNVLGVLSRELLGLLGLEFVLEQELFII